MSVQAPTLARDVRVIGLVGSAHFFSHFFQLTLPPLFPLLRDEFGAPWVAFGAMMSAFYAASGVGQLVAGFVVDRFGARNVLLLGMSLLAGAIALAGLSGSYPMMLAVVLLAGLGNSVFHPADYAIFNASVDPRRLARAYSAHSIFGNFGWVAAPVVIITLTGVIGWRGALVTAGGAGLLYVLVLATQSGVLTDHRAGAAAGPQGLAGDIRLLLTTPILLAFAYFALLATSLIGIQTFGVSGMVAIYDAPLAQATGALTAFLLGNSAGILTGGFLADRTSRHDIVAGSGMLLAGAFAVVMASGLPSVGLLPVVMGLAGFCLGSTSPSRDMLVRKATPVGASGKVYGFVYSGLDLGSLVTPVVYGLLLDRGEPRAIFLVSAVLMVLTTITVVQVRRHSPPVSVRA